MAELTIQEVVEGGLEATYASATGGGDYFTPTSNEPHVIHVVNGGASPITVEVNDPTSTSPAGAQSFDPDLGVTVTNAESRFILVLPRRFKDPVTNRVDITYSGVSSVTVAILLVAQ